MIKKRIAWLLVFSLALSLVGVHAMAEDNRYTVEYIEADGFYRITNPNGGTSLSYTSIDILEVEEDGYVYAFKDLNKNGVLDPYEDWRLSYEDRAADIAGQLSLESIAGLMLFSAHTGPNPDGSVTEEQYNYVINDGVRAVLYAMSTDYTLAIKWSNEFQAITEANDPLGIPVNFSSDPRNSAQGSVENDLANTTYGSGWPTNLALAATFDAEYAFKMGQIISAEYRAIGIGTALSPQIDLATEPRWSRFSGTYGEDVALASDIASAIVSGMQSTWAGLGSEAEDLGWGKESIIAMVKHFPGDGAAEAGREAHNNYGKFNVYPGENLADHVAVFTATMDLGTKTEMAMAVMPSYSVAIDKYGNGIGQRVGSGYSAYKLVDLLRGELGFVGVICSDWGITSGTIWGVENLTVVQRHLLAIMNGLDMFGGNNAAKPVLDAYDVGKIVYTQEYVAPSLFSSGQPAVDGVALMDDAFFKIAYRVLYNEFVLGLFDDAYLCTEESAAVFTDAEYAQLGYEAQQNSIVLLKNKGGVLGAAGAEKKTVYVPMQIASTELDYMTQMMILLGWIEAPTVSETVEAHILGDWSSVGFEQMEFDGKIEYAFPLDLLSEHFNVVTDELREGTDLNEPTEEDIVRRTDFTGVDFALLSVDAPKNGSGYEGSKVNLDPAVGEIDNGYYPISLIFGDYSADPANIRPVPLGLDENEELAWQAAGGVIGGSRYYGGKTTEGTNKADLEMILNTREAIGEDIPLVVYVSAGNPFCLYEFEPMVDGIVLGLGISSNAVLDILSGRHEPQGLLPMQLPLNMETVEKQFEDVGLDMDCHVDTDGNVYDFGYGLNWSGVIADARTAKYVK